MHLKIKAKIIILSKKVLVKITINIDEHSVFNAHQVHSQDISLGERAHEGPDIHNFKTLRFANKL